MEVKMDKCFFKGIFKGVLRLCAALQQAIWLKATNHVVLILL